MLGVMIRLLRRLYTMQVAKMFLLVAGTLAAILSVPILQPLITGPGKPAVSTPPPPPPQAAEKWIFVGKGGEGVPRGLHADFVSVPSIKNLGYQRFRVRLANVYSKPQWHNTTLAKVVATVDCRTMKITYEEIAAFYRNGGHDGTVSADAEDAKSELATPGNFNHHAARYVCQGPIPSDREVAEADFYTLLQP